MVESYQHILTVIMKRYLTTLLAIAIIITLILIIRRSYIQYNSIVSIRNSRWERVRIQVRKGFAPDPANDKLIFDQFLTKGQARAFTIDNGDDIVYRRDLDPNHADGIHFTPWTYANCDGSSTCTVYDP